MRFTLSVLAMVCLARAGHAEGEADPEKWVREAESALGKVDSYTAVFHKRDRIKGTLLIEETIFLKFKKPFKVYMKWITDPHKGRETLFVEGWNNNKIKAHEGGLLGIVNANLDPAGAMAMKGNRHPITDVGLEKLVGKTGANLRRAVKRGDLELRLLGEETVYGRRTQKVEAIYATDLSKGYYCYRTVTNFDLELKVPIRIMVYDWDDELVESYGYENLKLNPGLTDADFNPDNKDYRF